MSWQSQQPTAGIGMDSLLDTAPCGFVSFSDTGTVAIINSTLLDMLGYARGEVVGRHVEILFTLASRIYYQAHFFPLLKLHEKANEIFLALQDKEGKEVGVLASARRVERDGVIANDCVFLLVHERRKYEAELIRAKKTAEEAKVAAELREQLLARAREEADEANHAKSAFLATMSHELRTPLNAIGGYTQLLELGIHGPVTTAQREAFARIQRSQRHLLRLVNDVLNLARIEAGHVDYVLENVSFAEVVANVLPMIEPQLDAKALTYEINVAPEHMARADREKLQQILLNLLTNAMKFTASGGRITIDTPQRGDMPDTVFLRVTDTGVGIPRNRLEGVFEPFVQVDVSHTRPHEGTGLGLAISRDLARGMGGDLRARSVENEGSTFTIVLPAAQND